MILRLLTYLWALPLTCLGLVPALLALLGRGQARVIDGVLEVHGGPVAWLLRRAVPLPNGAAALCLGHVVLGRSAEALVRTRAHERVHVRQAERWGPFFAPAYLVGSLAAYLRGGHPYRDNPFEQEAFAATA